MTELEVNGQSDKMPTMPITLSDSSYSDLKLKESSLMSASETAATPQKTAEIPKSSPVSTPSVDTNRQTRHPATAGGQPTVPHRRTAMDFRFGRPIGEGSFSTVYMAEDIHTRKEYAIKVCNKAHIIKERKADYIRREREVLNTLSTCDGFVSLYCTFQDATNLYFVLSLAKKGDMLPAINRVGSFTLSCARHYAAELVLALEKMHCKGVIHRDLKPENILMDEKMHTLLTDFGSSKMLGLPNGLELLTNADAPSEAESELCQPENNRTERRRKNSFVGTAQYVSPEVLQNQPTGRATDLWALGAIIYQMISGLPPFRGATEYIIFQKVLKREIAFPTGFDETAADFVSQLLQLNPNERLGMTDTEKTYDSLRSHPFFEGIDWEEMRNVDPPAINPYLPGLENEDLQQSNYRVPEHIEPGLDENRITRLELGLEMFSGARSTDSTPTSTVSSTHSSKRNIFDISEEEMKSRLEQQSQTNKWHPFADGELIVKQGFVNKRKGLFARKRMLLLTTGPRLIYIDPFQMVKKGEIEWTSALRVEPKNFKIFFVHTPNRTYYLEDSEGHKAQEWCDAINDVRLVTYGSK